MAWRKSPFIHYRAKRKIKIEREGETEKKKEKKENLRYPFLVWHKVPGYILREARGGLSAMRVPPGNIDVEGLQVQVYD